MIDKPLLEISFSVLLQGRLTNNGSKHKSQDGQREKAAELGIFWFCMIGETQYAAIMADNYPPEFKSRI